MRDAGATKGDDDDDDDMDEDEAGDAEANIEEFIRMVGAGLPRARRPT